MERMNNEGLTWEEWLAATGDAYRGISPIKMKRAWRRGEDPTEYRAMAESFIRELEVQFVGKTATTCEPRYASRDNPGVLCVQRVDGYYCASFTVPLVSERYPDLWHGLSVEVGYHYGRCCFYVERHYTAPTPGREGFSDHEYHSDFDEALRSVVRRQLPANAVEAGIKI